MHGGRSGFRGFFGWSILFVDFTLGGNTGARKGKGVTRGNNPGSYSRVPIGHVTVARSYAERDGYKKKLSEKPGGTRRTFCHR